MPDRNPMKEWVQVTAAHQDQWFELALAALNYVQELAQKSSE